MLPSNSLPLLRSLRSPATGVSSTSSSLDSCISAFPSLPPQTTKPAAVQQFTTAQSQQQFSTMSQSASNSKSPLLSALMEMSEGSTVTESAIASSDDEMFSSPLLSVTKVRRFSEKKKTSSNKQDFHNTPSLSYIRALGQWQEQAFPPVPAIPAQFQEQALRGSGWSKCGTTANTDGRSKQIGSQSVKGNHVDFNRRSITNSSSITTLHSPSSMTMNSPSELSLDTCDTSVNTCTSTIRSPKQQQQQDARIYKISSMTHLSDKRRSPFAFNIGTTDSLASLGSCTPSQLDTPRRRIAFSPSIRVDDSTPTEVNWSRSNLSKIDGISPGKKYMSPSGGVMNERLPPPPPPPPPSKENRKGASKKAVFDPSRPSTAPHPNRKPTEASAFRKLLRPISRAANRPFSSNGKTAKLEVKEREKRERMDQGRFVDNSLHVEAQYPMSHQCNTTSSYQGTRMERLPTSPRPFDSYNSNLINGQIKDNHRMQRNYIEDAFLHEMQFTPGFEGDCRSYVDMESHDSRPKTGQIRAYRPGDTMPLSINKNGGMGKFKRAVGKMTDKLANRGAQVGQDEYGDRSYVYQDQFHQYQPPPQEQYREVIERQNEQQAQEQVRFAQPKMGFRPSTAPSMAVAPRWNNSSFNSKNIKIESRQNQVLQSTNQEWHNSDPFRATELTQWKRNPEYPPPPIRRHPWDTTPETNTYQSSDALIHPRQYSLLHSNRDFYPPPASLVPIQSRTVPSPVSRVSPDQLRRMQPVKIVKYPSFDPLNVI